MAAPWVLSIDFGTTNTAAAHCEMGTGRIEVISLGHTRFTMPSAVYIEDPNHIAVGDVARNKADADPAGYVPAPKRLITQQSFIVNGFEILTVTAISDVLRSVVARARREHEGQLPQRLVLTHPEAWSDNEIGVLRAAAQRVGFGRDQIITLSEPQAALYHYAHEKSFVPGNKFAVCDFGGGTLDIAVLALDSSGQPRVIAARGDNSLGGRGFDALLRRWVDKQLQPSRPDLVEYLARQAPLFERRSLEDSIIQAKELLSESPQATITVMAQGQVERLNITRAEFEKIIAPSVERVADLVRQVLLDAGTPSNQLKALYLTGGSSRIPLIQEYLRKVGPVATLDDPKTVVVQGALYDFAPRPRTAANPETVAEPKVQKPTSSGSSNTEHVSTSSSQGMFTSNERRGEQDMPKPPETQVIPVADPAQQPPTASARTTAPEAPQPPAPKKKGKAKRLLSLLIVLLVGMSVAYALYDKNHNSARNSAADADASSTSAASAPKKPNSTGSSSAKATPSSTTQAPSESEPKQAEQAEQAAKNLGLATVYCTLDADHVYFKNVEFEFCGIDEEKTKKYFPTNSNNVAALFYISDKDLVQKIMNQPTDSSALEDALGYSSASKEIEEETYDDGSYGIYHVKNSVRDEYIMLITDTDGLVVVVTGFKSIGAIDDFLTDYSS